MLSDGVEAPGRVELPTNGLGNRCSIHLSYGAVWVCGVVGLRNFFRQMQPGSVPVLHLFDGFDPPAKARELRKFLLDCLQALMPLAVRDLSIRLISVLRPILFVQPLNLSNLRPETPDLFP